jgi:branched-chain amino acid transport system ATP-binding protein
VSAILELQGLAKAFGALRAVDGVDLAVEEGEFTAVIGPNGAGKTTLFNLVTGALRPDAGRTLLRSRDITGWPPPRILRAGLGRTFQITSIFHELSALDNVRVAALARLRRSAVFWRPYGDDAEAREQAEAALAELGLLPVADEVAGTLSHADQKLVEVAMALAAGPAVLLLDEPTSGLAPEETERVAAVLRRLGERQRVTIILIEHDMDVVFAVAERIVVLHQGRIIADGDPVAIRADATVREVYLGGSFAERERSPHLSG